jgi:hypothetical protein
MAQIGCFLLHKQVTGLHQFVIALGPVSLISSWCQPCVCAKASAAFSMLATVGWIPAAMLGM